jgi:hypothetical protein
VTPALSKPVRYWGTIEPVLAWLLLLITLLAVIRLWLEPTEAWMHPEAGINAGMVWDKPTTETTADRLAKILPQLQVERRARPISVATEIAEAVARPYWTAVVGYHPSLAPVGLATLLLAPVLLYGYLRRSGMLRLQAAALAVLCLTSVGFLSALIPYIRPAKKWSVLLFCLCLYLGQRHSESRSPRAFWAFVAALCAAFLADEEDLALFGVLGLLFAPSLLLTAPWWKRLVFLSLPLGYVVVAQWGIPFLLGLGGLPQWNIFGDSRQSRLLPYLLASDFHLFAANQIARNLLTTISVATHNAWTEAATLLVFLAATCALAWRLRDRSDAAAVRYRLLASSLALLLTGIYLGLLD